MMLQIMIMMDRLKLWNFHLIASRFNTYLPQSSKLKMASQSAPSSAAMDVALGEEVIISMFQWQCNSSFYVIAINYF